MLEQLKYLNVKMVAFADDLTADGTFNSLRLWWDDLMQIGPKFGYHPQPKKSWLIVKDARIADAKTSFNGTNVQLTTDGERHLGSVIGSAKFRKSYCASIVEEWVKEIEILAEVAVTEPQAVYTCYISGYQHKFTYFLRTIPHFEQHLTSLEQVIRHRLLPAILGGHTVTDQERNLLALPPRLGGIGIKIPHECAEFEYQSSRKVTESLVQKIIDGKTDDNDNTQTKQQIKTERNKRYEETLEHLRGEMNYHQKRQNEANRETGSYNWLTTLPIKELGYNFKKEEFWDAVRIRYNWDLPRLPSECACGNKFDLSHAISCKKGGFISIRHNEIRDITALLLKEVCHDVKKEPMLMAVNNENLREPTAIRGNEARLDVSASGFWVKGQRVFCDVRVFDPNAQRYRNTELSRCYQKNEEEKKRIQRANTSG